MAILDSETGEIKCVYEGAEIIYLDGDYIFLKGTYSSLAKSIQTDRKLRKLRQITSLPINGEEFCFYEICDEIKKEEK